MLALGVVRILRNAYGERKVAGFATPHMKFFQFSNEIYYGEMKRGHKWPFLVLRNIQMTPYIAYKKLTIYSKNL